MNLALVITPIFRMILIRKLLKPNYPHTKVTYYNATVDNPTVIKLFVDLFAMILLYYLSRMYGLASYFADRQVVIKEYLVV